MTESVSMYPEINTSVLVLVDVQERLYSAIPSAPQALNPQKVMLKAAEIFGLSVIVTEQYPKGLGNTVPELREIFLPQWPVIEKTSFSCFGEVEFRRELAKVTRKAMIIIGMETHVCVQQTAFDALAQGLDVWLLTDAVVSRSDHDRETAFQLMLHWGVTVSTVQGFLFAMMRDSKNPFFREISALVK